MHNFTAHLSLVQFRRFVNMYKICKRYFRPEMIIKYNSVRCLSANSRFCGNTSVGKSDVQPYQRISDYYAGKSVFITGGTGFLGKVLIERLLYNCSDIKNIYVLIRGKKGLSADDRLQQIFHVPLFEKLKSINPNAFNKIMPIEGDITMDELGIKPEDEQLLIDNVSVVFHSAATVSFTDSFRNIMSTNFEGTRKVVTLSKKIKNLETLLYISTAYSNSDKLMIDEMIYPPKKRIDEAYSFINEYGDNTYETKKFLRGMANTYTLSKALCENYINDNHKPMKTIIVRPSVVTPVYKDPIPGWIDSWVVFTALFSDIAGGLTRVMYSDRNCISDMIPCDYICNLAIVAAARGNKSDNVKVYNSCSSSTNPITMKQAADLYMAESLKQGQNALKPTPVLMIPSHLAVNILSLLETVPPLFADLWLRLTGQKPRYIKKYVRARLLKHIISPASLTSFNFKSNNSQSLIETMDEEDKVRFPCDPRTIVWRDYMEIFYRGVRKYLKM